MADLLMTGAPVYWVLKQGLNYNNVSHQNLICGGTGCNNDSLTTKLYLSSQYEQM